MRSAGQGLGEIEEGGADDVVVEGWVDLVVTSDVVEGSTLALVVTTAGVDEEVVISVVPVFEQAAAIVRMTAVQAAAKPRRPVTVFPSSLLVDPAMALDKELKRIVFRQAVPV